MTTNRVLYLGDADGEMDKERGIDAKAAHDIIQGLKRMRGDRPIHLLINSYGGEDDAARAIIDAIESDPRDIIGVVYGRAESAAAWIFECCDRRIMMPRSSLMFHMGSGDKTAHSEWIDRMFIDDMLRRLQEKDPSYPRNKLVKELKKDWYIYSSQAVALGLADQVGGK